MKRLAVLTSLSLGFVIATGAVPGCSCADVPGAGDLAGQGDGFDPNSDGFNGDGGNVNACGDDDPSCTVVCVGPTCTPPGQFPLPSDNPSPPNVGADGVNRNPMGYIVLDASKATFDFLWIANDTNYGSGTVSKVSTKAFPTAPTYRETARYATVTCQSDKVKGSKEGIVFGTNVTQALCADGENGCCARHEAIAGANGKHQPVNVMYNRPSRTAVDFNGDVWVANRAFGRQSSVTKIANSIQDCVERNGMAGIQTSSDTNNDGIITTDCNDDNIPDDKSTVCTAGRQKEFWGLDDECILFTTNTGPVDVYGRPLALGPGATDFGPSDAWAGTYVDGKFYRIDGTTGLIKTTVTAGPVNGVAANPYGAAVDQFGILWAPNIGGTGCNPAGCLFYFDTNNPANRGMVQVPAAFASGGGFYGIAIDGYKENGVLVQQIWMAAVYAEGFGAYRYRPKRGMGFAALGMGEWARGLVRGTGELTQGRGIGVDNRTPTSFVWVALDGGGIAKIPFDIPSNVTTNFSTATNLFRTNQSGTLGAGVAVDLDIWGINQGSSSASHFRVDAMGNVLNAGAPDTIPLDDKPTAAEGFCTTPLSGQCKPHPYTYSDFTGFGLRNFTNPRGTYSWTQTGCGPMKTKWLRVEWDGDYPLGTKIAVRVRSADDQVSLASAPFYGEWSTSPADLSMAPGPIMPNPSGLLDVQFVLTTMDKNTTPALKSFKILYECVNALN